MRFKEFLREAVDLPEILKSYEKNLGILIDKKICLYRIHSGVKYRHYQDFDWSEITARATPRASMASNLMLFLSTTWGDEFPNRTRSYFASQSFSHIKDFVGMGSDQSTVLVIPKDSISKFGFSDDDFNGYNHSRARQSFFNLIVVMVEVFNHMKEALKSKSKVTPIVAQLFKDANLSPSLEFDDVPFEQMDNLIDLLDSIYRRYSEIRPLIADRGFAYQLDSLIKDVESMGYDSLEDAIVNYGPKEHEIEAHKSLATIPKSQEDENEIWFEGDFLAIGIGDHNKDHAYQILKSLQGLLK
jgi:hypothetical protein